MQGEFTEPTPYKFSHFSGVFAVFERLDVDGKTEQLAIPSAEMSTYPREAGIEDLIEEHNLKLPDNFM